MQARKHFRDTGDHKCEARCAALLFRGRFRGRAGGLSDRLCLSFGLHAASSFYFLGNPTLFSCEYTGIHVIVYSGIFIFRPAVAAAGRMPGGEDLSGDS